MGAAADEPDHRGGTGHVIVKGLAGVSGAASPALASANTSSSA